MGPGSILELFLIDFGGSFRFFWLHFEIFFFGILGKYVQIRGDTPWKAVQKNANFRDVCATVKPKGSGAIKGDPGRIKGDQGG